MELKKFVDFDNLTNAFAARTDEALKQAHFIFSTMQSPGLVKVGTTLTTWSLKMGLPVKGIIRKTIFNLFCGGETLDGCQRATNDLAAFGIGAIFDYSVEGEKTEEGFDGTAQEIMRTIDRASQYEYIRFSAFKVTGLAHFDLLAKITAGEKLTAEEEAAYERVKARVDMICAEAKRKNVSVLIDAEETWIQKPISDMTKAMMIKYNTEKALIYYTFQMYAHSMLDHLKELHAHAKANNYRLGAKLVRGAYMEIEADRAEKMGYENPIQPSKEATDRDFDLATEYCIQHIDEIGLFAGSHNEKSNYLGTLFLEKYGLARDDRRVYFGQLYGMGDHISFNLADAGYNVIKYVPYGPIKATIPYLIRRANENTSVRGQSSRELSLIKKERKRRKEAKKQLAHQDKF
ncbi:proline dehydrogenase family protein [Roseivirga echinicomitans]